MLGVRADKLTGVLRRPPFRDALCGSRSAWVFAGCGLQRAGAGPSATQHHGAGAWRNPSLAQVHLVRTAACGTRVASLARLVQLWRATDNRSDVLTSVGPAAARRGGAGGGGGEGGGECGGGGSPPLAFSAFHCRDLAVPVPLLCLVRFLRVRFVQDDFPLSLCVRSCVFVCVVV